MGLEVCSAVTAAPDLELVAQVGSDDPLDRLTVGGAQVAVDFTHPDVVLEHLQWCLAHGISVVTGTSGLVGPKLRQVQQWLEDAPGLGVVVASNFAIGAVLAARFARMAAPFFDSAEVLELHHAGKVDAPSFTATTTAQGIAAAREAAGLPGVPDATTTDPLGARGADVDGIRVHAVRLPGLVAHLQVLLGSAGETLTIRHDSLARSSFMPGVVHAVREVGRRPGLTVGLDAVLGLDDGAPA
jgi:4-hydroxy-tetrahydrodipicolinate reductase